MLSWSTAPTHPCIPFGGFNDDAFPAEGLGEFPDVPNCSRILHYS